MKTVFLTTRQKINLQDNPDRDKVMYLMSELDRLEIIIRNYETGIEMLNEKACSESFKKPFYNENLQNTIL